MIRKVLTAALIAAFASATSPSFACTGISLKAADGAAIRGRTLEFGFPMQSKVLVIPAGTELSGTLPDGSKGLVYKSKYAMVGANALGMPVFLDGINDQGLSVGLFYFPGYAKYADVTPENASHALAGYEFGVWALANFATVDEVREAVKSIVLVPTPAPGLGSPQGAVPGAHFFLQDKTGKSLVVEPVDGTLKVYDAPLGVMTNAPTYDWHMTNLANYVNLSLKDVESAKLGSVTVNSFGAGAGLLGLPGDFTPPSRFVRAVVYSQAAAPNATAEDAVLSAFHILNQFDIPKGSVVNSAGGEAMDETTEWTSVADLKNLRWYFRTFEDQSIHMVDLKQAVEAAKGEMATIEMEGTKQPINNVSSETVAVKQASR
jgi:choloylglycine hydrolase